MGRASSQDSWEHRLLSIIWSPCGGACSGDLPDERPLLFSRFYRGYKAKQGKKQRHDATTLQRCCTQWQALHSPPTRSQV
jgi:hypothetical protein